MSNINHGPLSSYNSLTDAHLTDFFANSRLRTHLKKSGLITKHGEIVSENIYRLNMSRKEHKKHVKEMLAQAIVFKSLDLERARQAEIKRTLEQISKIQLVRRVRESRSRKRDADVLPYLNTSSRLQSSLSPQAHSSRNRNRAKSAPAKKGKHSLSDLSSNFEDDVAYLDEEMTISPTHGEHSSSRYSSREFVDRKHFPSGGPIDTKNFASLDTVALRKYAMIMAKMDQGRGGISSPYLLPQVPLPPKSPRGSHNPRSANRYKSSSKDLKKSVSPKRSSTSLYPLGPAKLYKGQQETTSEIHMHYHGTGLSLSREEFDKRQDILVEQQHCGGNTLIVFKDKLEPKSNFSFVSYRHRGYPFSLSIYIDGKMDSRVSTCCEYRHKQGTRIGGRTGHFSIQKVIGANPCYRCQVDKGFKLGNRAPRPKLKSIQQNQEETVTVPKTDDSKTPTPDKQKKHKKESEPENHVLVPVDKIEDQNENAAKYADDFEPSSKSSSSSSSSSSSGSDNEASGSDAALKRTQPTQLKKKRAVKTRSEGSLQGDNTRTQAQVVGHAEVSVDDDSVLSSSDRHDGELVETPSSKDVTLEDKQIALETQTKHSDEGSSTEVVVETPISEAAPSEDHQKLVETDKDQIEQENNTVVTESSLHDDENMSVSRTVSVASFSSSSSSSSLSSARKNYSDSEREESTSKHKDEKDVDASEEVLDSPTHNVENLGTVNVEVESHDDSGDESRRETKYDVDLPSVTSESADESQQLKEMSSNLALEGKTDDDVMDLEKWREKELSDEAAEVKEDTDLQLSFTGSPVTTPVNEDEKVELDKEEKDLEQDTEKMDHPKVLLTSIVSPITAPSFEIGDDVLSVEETVTEHDTDIEEEKKEEQEIEIERKSPTPAVATEISQETNSKRDVLSRSSSSLSSSSSSSSSTSSHGSVTISDRERDISTMDPAISLTTDPTQDNKEAAPVLDNLQTPAGFSNDHSTLLDSDLQVAASGNDQPETVSDNVPSKTVSDNEHQVAASDTDPPRTVSDNDQQESILDSNPTETVSDNDSHKSKSDNDSHKSDSDNDSKKSDSDNDSKKSKSDNDSKKSDSDNDSKKSKSDNDSKKSKSVNDSKKSDSDNDSQKSDLDKDLQKTAAVGTHEDSTTQNVASRENDIFTEQHAEETGSNQDIVVDGLAGTEPNPTSRSDGSPVPQEAEKHGADEFVQTEGRIINMANLDIGDDMVKAKLDDLKNSSSNPVVVNLSNTPLTSDCVSSVLDLLKTKPSVEAILLGNTRLGDDEVSELVDGILKLHNEKVKASEENDGVKELQELDLSNCKFGNIGAESLAHLIKSTIDIDTLNLSSNRAITSDGWMAIGNALEDNTSLETLTLDYNDIGNEGVEYIANGLQVNKSITTVDLNSVGLRERGGECLMNMLKKNTTIIELNLEGNDISQELKEDMQKYIKLNKTMVNEKEKKGTRKNQLF